MVPINSSLFSTTLYYSVSKASFVTTQNPFHDVITESDCIYKSFISLNHLHLTLFKPRCQVSGGLKCEFGALVCGYIRKPKHSGKTLSRSHVIHNKLQIEWPGTEPWPPLWDADNWTNIFVQMNTAVFVMASRYCISAGRHVTVCERPNALNTENCTT